MMPTFSDRLIELRRRSGMTEAEMCAWLGGVPKSTLGSWTRGRRTPTWHAIDPLNRALDYLEKELKTRRRLPLPLGVRKDDRVGHVESIRRDYPPE
jgi:transcriptional regulator with XRE-family HTH domain